MAPGPERAVFTPLSHFLGPHCPDLTGPLYVPPEGEITPIRPNAMEAKK